MHTSKFLGFCFALTIGFNVAAQDLSSLDSLPIRDIEVSGDLIPPDVLDSTLASYRNRQVTAGELLLLAQQLTQYLIEQGYVNSGVILPDQQVNDGVVRLRIVAGRLDRVNVDGNRNVPERYIAARVASVQTDAFNINRAVEGLQVLERDPLIKRLNAELKPSVERGLALLNINVEEARAYGASAGVDNHISPNVGQYRVFVDAYHRSVFGLRDSFAVDYRHAEGYSGGSAEYRVPLTARNTSIGVNFSADSSRIVTEPFAQLDIRGESRRYGVSIGRPFIDSPQTQFSLELGAQREQVESFLLGEPFSFSASDPDGVSTVVMAQFTQEWVRRGRDRVVALRSTLNVGLDAWDASVGGDADGEFIEWVGQGEWLQKTAWRNSAVAFRIQAHLANDELPAFRKYPLGGAQSVRGYRENVFTRDNGVAASLEWSVPIVSAPVRWLSFGEQAIGGQPEGQIALAPFVDYGRGWDYADEGAEAVDLVSAGLSLRWRLAQNSSMEIQYAKSLREQEPLSVERVLQDDGVHFSMRIGF